jgi:hypothetical protein
METFWQPIQEETSWIHFDNPFKRRHHGYICNPFRRRHHGYIMTTHSRDTMDILWQPIEEETPWTHFDNQSKGHDGHTLTIHSRDTMDTLSYFVWWTHLGNLFKTGYHGHIISTTRLKMPWTHSDNQYKFSFWQPVQRCLGHWQFNNQPRCHLINSVWEILHPLSHCPPVYHGHLGKQVHVTRYHGIKSTEGCKNVQHHGFLIMLIGQSLHKSNLGGKFTFIREHSLRAGLNLTTKTARDEISCEIQHYQIVQQIKLPACGCWTIW